MPLLQTILENIAGYKEYNPDTQCMIRPTKAYRRSADWKGEQHIKHVTNKVPTTDFSYKRRGSSFPQQNLQDQERNGCEQEGEAKLPPPDAATRALEIRRTLTIMSMPRARPTDEALASQLRTPEAAKHELCRRILDLVSKTRRRAHGSTPIKPNQPITRILGPRVSVGPNRDTLPRKRLRTSHGPEVRFRVTLLEEGMSAIFVQIVVPVTLGQRLDILQIWLSTLKCLLPVIPHDRDAIILLDMNTRLGHDPEWILDDE